MKSFLIRLRNWKIKLLYRWLARPYFFKRDPEDVHDWMLKFGAKLGKNKFMRGVTRLCFSYSHPALYQRILGADFRSPVGLAAGFDKNAEIVDILPAVGFGFAEIGSVTGQACSGNPKPRIWRLVKKKALAVYYGLKNDGAAAVCARLRGGNGSFPVGISIAKTNSQDTVEEEAGISDYALAMRECMDVGSYVTVNVSCPNAFGGQPFHDAERMEKLFKALDKIDTGKPVLVKISPDLSNTQVDQLIEVARRHKVDGFVIANLTKDLGLIGQEAMEGRRGGVSGKPLEERVNELIAYVYQKTKGSFVIIGCGGIFSAEDAYRKIRLGASLVQLITGMIYEGPQLVSSINEGLVRLMHKDGYTNIRDVVGDMPKS